MSAWTDGWGTPYKLHAIIDGVPVCRIGNKIYPPQKQDKARGAQAIIDNYLNQTKG